MNISKEFLESALNSQESNMVVVDAEFNIVFTNKAWSSFGRSNGLHDECCWDGVNYMTPCRKSAEAGDEYSIAAVKGFEELQRGDISEFSLEYPCHSESESRWFMMKISPFQYSGASYFVITHYDITTRVMLEAETKRLATLDGLTQIANRRSFEDFLNREWSHCLRNDFPISLALVDLDDFKVINDSCGHPEGDKCLKELANILQEYAGRASDICARFGGDEFVVVWGNITHEHAITLTNSILSEINNIRLTDSQGEVYQGPTVSIGLSTVVPVNKDLERFVSHTDRLLYNAKRHGKNRICAEFLIGEL
jgi:diguanylate cyclase (GGDEF)-like protein